MKLHILCLSQTPSMCKGWPRQVLQSSTTNHIIGLPSASSSVGRLSETGPDAWSYQGGSYGTTVVLKKSKNQFSSITMVLKFLKQLLIRLLVLEHENCRFWEIFEITETPAILWFYFFSQKPELAARGFWNLSKTETSTVLYQFK